MLFNGIFITLKRFMRRKLGLYIWHEFKEDLNMYNVAKVAIYMAVMSRVVC